jgi:hypothetical protein
MRMNWPGMPLSDAIAGVERFASSVVPAFA